MCLQLLWSRTRVSTLVLASLLILLLRTPHTLRQALHPKRSMFGVLLIHTRLSALTHPYTFTAFAIFDYFLLGEASI